MKARQTTTVSAALAAARARAGAAGFIGEAELYCETSSCSFRVVRAELKEFPGHPTTPGTLPCSGCGHQLKLHWVRTLEEKRAEGDRACRSELARRFRQFIITFTENPSEIERFSRMAAETFDRWDAGLDP
jgi:hypothetical protein